MMSPTKTASIAISLFCTFTATAAVAQTPAWTNQRSINQISEHVYRFGATQNAMFIVTPAGIVLVDGSCDNMEWLKGELKQRFNLPVKYAVMSHDHQSHICDMDVFADTAVGIAHVNMLPHVLREKRKTIIPQVLFEDRMEIELGGIKVALIHLGPTHSDNMIYVHVPADGVMFAPDFGRGRNILPDFRDLDIHNALKALGTLERWPDVRIVLEGHDKFTQTQQQAFGEFRRYLQAVRDRVLERIVAGKSLSEIRKEVTMVDFKEFNQSPERVLVHVDTTFDYLWRYREPTIGGPQVPVRAPRD
jgi:glyoxylase-like metal-dependent hydrolase (beta-lactamase superfamily II)